jgi:F0F1-type ATP synthase delta subunit
MLKVTITTANKVDVKTLEPLKKALTKKHGKDTVFEIKVNSEVIGGIKIVVGSKAIDRTVAGQLSQVKKQLLTQV